MGNVKIKQKKYKESEEYCKKAIELCKKDKTHKAFVWACWSGCKIELNELEKASEFAQKAIDLDSKHKSFYSLKGDIFKKLKKYEEAIENFKKSLMSNNYAAKQDSVMNIAVCYAELDNVKSFVEYTNLYLEKYKNGTEDKELAKELSKSVNQMLKKSQKEPQLTNIETKLKEN